MYVHFSCHGIFKLTLNLVWSHPDAVQLIKDRYNLTGVAFNDNAAWLKNITM